MKRRRWWSAGVALALLTVYGGMVAWNETPPYEFAQGAKIDWVEVYEGRAQIYYLLPKRGGDMAAEARREVLGKWYVGRSASDNYPNIRNRTGPLREFLPDFEWSTRTGTWSVGSFQPRSPSTSPVGPPSPMVVLDRRACYFDVARAWVYGLSR